MSLCSSRSSSMCGTFLRMTSCAAAAPTPAFSGPRRSSACAATSSSIASPLPAFSTAVRALIAAVIPMLTWSSRPADDGIVSTQAGCARILLSAASAAAVTCAIMNPELRPLFLARNGGSPESDGFTSCSTRRSEMVCSCAQAIASRSSACDTGCPWKFPALTTVPAPLRLPQGEHADRLHRLRAVHQRESFLRLEHHGLKPGARERLPPREPLSPRERFPLADQHQREVCERRQIAARAHGALLRNDRNDVAMQHLEEQLQGALADARISPGEHVGAQQHERPHLGQRQRRAGARRV